mmetsp:Transcript_279/g.158  ORF Transcript_279/g.158 Transcript_279/m.158 type:complete len:91 (-) Transcript_279:1115-1387(-)
MIILPFQVHDHEIVTMRKFGIRLLIVNIPDNNLARMTTGSYETAVIVVELGDHKHHVEVLDTFEVSVLVPNSGCSVPRTSDKLITSLVPL